MLNIIIYTQKDKKRKTERQKDRNIKIQKDRKIERQKYKNKVMIESSRD